MIFYALRTPSSGTFAALRNDRLRLSIRLRAGREDAESDVAEVE